MDMEITRWQTKEHAEHGIDRCTMEDIGKAMPNISRSRHRIRSQFGTLQHYIIIKKRNLKVVDNPDIRARYQQEIEKEIAATQLDRLGIDERERALTAIIHNAVETTVPVTEQPKKTWITEKHYSWLQEKENYECQDMNRK